MVIHKKCSRNIRNINGNVKSIIEKKRGKQILKESTGASIERRREKWKT
jgi:hypothetical protein